MSDLDFVWGSQGQRGAKSVWFIFLPTFELFRMRCGEVILMLRMRCDEVIQLFKLNIPVGLQSDIYGTKENN